MYDEHQRACLPLGGIIRQMLRLTTTAAAAAVENALWWIVMPLINKTRTLASCGAQNDTDDAASRALRNWAKFIGLGCSFWWSYSRSRNTRRNMKKRELFFCSLSCPSCKLRDSLQIFFETLIFFKYFFKVPLLYSILEGYSAAHTHTLLVWEEKFGCKFYAKKLSIYAHTMCQLFSLFRSLSLNRCMWRHDSACVFLLLGVCRKMWT